MVGVSEFGGDPESEKVSKFGVEKSSAEVGLASARFRLTSAKLGPISIERGLASTGCGLWGGGRRPFGRTNESVGADTQGMQAEFLQNRGLPC